MEALQKKYDDLLGKYRQLVDFYDKHNGTPCEQIRHQQQVEALQRELEAVDKIVNGTKYAWIGHGNGRVETFTQMLKDAQALDAEREKVKELEAKVELQETAVRCAGHALDESRETHNRQAAKIREQQEQLTQLQELVRVYFTEPDPHKWTAAYRALKHMGRTLDATLTERG